MYFNCVTTLIYHELYKTGIESKYKYAFSSKEFSAQLNLIRESNLQVLTAEELRNLLISGDNQRKKSLLITFDDGHISNYHIALPLLIEYGLKATFFITTDWIGKTDYLNKSEIVEMANHGMSVQSHAKTHNFLDQMPKQDIHTELYSSKCKIEDIIGREVSSLSIPGGRFNELVIECAKDVGYKAIFTSISFQLKHESDIWFVGRTGMRCPFDRSSFNKLLASSPSLIFKIKLISRGKQVLRSLLGGRFYYTLWKQFVKK